MPEAGTTLPHKKLPWFDGIFVAALVAAFFSMFWFMMNSSSFMLFGKIITRVQTNEKVVALTLDDGPLPGATEDTLRALKKEGVKATFFVIGVEAKRHMPQLKAIIAAGHEVGNHSYSHKPMTFMTPDEVAREIEDNDNLIRLAGYKGKIPFRVPYNTKFVTLPYYLMSHDRPDISRDVMPLEGKKVTAEKITADVVSRVRPGSIILLHPMYLHTATTREALPHIVEQLKKRGYRFLTVSQLLALQKS